MAENGLHEPATHQATEQGCHEEAATRTVEVAGRDVRLPVGVRDAVVAAATFAIPAAPADLWLPAGLALLSPAPGWGLLSVAVVDYRDNDLGAYREIAIALAVRRGLRIGAYVHRLPVDDAFSDAAGRAIWGFPKTVEALTVDRDGDRIVGSWESDDGLVLRLVVDAGGRGRLPAQALRAYSVIDGRLHATRFLVRGEGFRAQRSGAKLELGTGAAADELRRLGLPKSATASMSMERMQARFDAPAPVS